jgi:hypothetical protein
MQEATREEITRAFICILVVLTLLAAYAWVGLYRLWSVNFHRKPIAGVYHFKLLGWLFLLVIMILCTIVILWFFSWFLL